MERLGRELVEPMIAEAQKSLDERVVENADLVDAGVRVFLYQKGYLHAKTISIDSEICSVGSANIDIRSFSINYEINAVLYSERLAKELEEDFKRDLMHCTEFDAAEYQKRSVATRFRDSAARILSPLL
jgi:cardiolipin synthase